MSSPALHAEFSIDARGAGEPFVVKVELLLQKGTLVLFGPSGSGKSLTLQALAGSLAPVAGFARLGTSPLFDLGAGVSLPAHKRGIGYIPQQHHLFPFCNVFQNVAFGLSRAERRADNSKVLRLMEELGIVHLAKAMPSQLSGGERQRVALARALAVEPRLLLLDEPFASIDVAGRRDMHRVLKAVLERHETPAVFVTHDPQEALALGDRLVRYERGRTCESGAPADILHHVVQHGRSELQ